MNSTTASKMTQAEMHRAFDVAVIGVFPSMTALLDKLHRQAEPAEQAGERAGMIAKRERHVCGPNGWRVTPDLLCVLSCMDSVTEQGVYARAVDAGFEAVHLTAKGVVALQS